MEQQRRSLQIGAAAIALAVVLRLSGSGFFTPLTRWLRQTDTASLFFYLETGRIVRAAPQSTQPHDPPTPTVSAATEPPAAAALPAPAVLTAADAERIQIDYDFSSDADIAALLTAPLGWSLRQDAPTVLILHTHTTESYEKDGAAYEESGSYRTLDERYNMLRVGDRLAELLEAGGVHVLHDRTLHDYPSYNGSYDDARASTQAILAENPSICLVLDLHRDAAEDANGNQVAVTAEIGGTQMARLMILAGSDANGWDHPNWQQNFSVALKLQAILETQAAGLCRPLNLSGQCYNEDLSPGALLIEVGAAGNTLTQATAAMEPLAQAILTLADGANTGT